MTTHRTPRFIKFACVLTLVSLALICWAIVHPAPLAVIAAMSLGQGLGTLGAILFGLVALRDIKPIFRSRRSSAPPPPPSRPSEAPAPKSEPRESEPPDSKAHDSKAPDSKAPDSKAPDSKAPDSEKKK